jgi:hypothetical protein
MYKAEQPRWPQGNATNAWGARWFDRAHARTRLCRRRLVLHDTRSGQQISKMLWSSKPLKMDTTAPGTERENGHVGSAHPAEAPEKKEKR